MKQLQTIEELESQLTELRETQEDYVTDGRAIDFRSDEEGSLITLKTEHGMQDYPVEETAHDCIADRLRIPQSYYSLMRKEYPELLDKNVKGWLEKTGKNVLVRVQSGNVRAVLSDKYRCLDNLELLRMAIPYISENYGDYHLTSCGLTDKHMYIKYVGERVRGEVRKGDVVTTGIVISNSEIGLGAVRVLPLIYRLVCTNGMIAGQAVSGTRKNHIGTQIYCEEGETRLVDPAVLGEKTDEFLEAVRSGLQSVTNVAVFNKLLLALRKATTQEFRTAWDSEELVRYTGKLFGLTMKEQDIVHRHYTVASDYSAYGLLNAITRASQDVESYSRATEMERMGARLLEPVNIRLINTHMGRMAA